jgi:hypothetical protein
LQKELEFRDKIVLAIGRVIEAKHFDLNITEDRFTFARNTAKIDTEAALDGEQAAHSLDVYRGNA